MINKKNRLKKDKEIEAVFKNKKVCYNKLVGVLIKKNLLKHNRFVVIVSSKTIKKASERNKIKRQVKAILKEKENSFSYNVDLVVLLKKDIVLSDIQQIEENLLFCFKKLKIIE